MRLNTVRPGRDSKRNPKRVGRGIGSGLGKTAGRGHKGQKSRSGGFHKVGFEGGQMPLQRRLPKFGFKSMVADKVAEITLYELGKASDDPVDLDALVVAGLISHKIKRVKVVLSGTLDRAVNTKGLVCTKGARAAIEAAGGKIED